MTQDLFGDFQDDSILAHLDNESGDTSRFPALLAELNDVLRQELSRLGVEPAHSLEIVVAICKHLGGGQVYIPRGQVLDSLIRDLRIWNDFNGRNVHELAIRHGVTFNTVYKAIRRMRRIKYRQYSPPLF
ncbi:transcriptional regulator [Salmonella enterica subsp. enterica serovar Newport]|nr:transcriptional regulator [Salmonella enterica subsp. enterica serovar Newport]